MTSVVVLGCYLKRDGDGADLCELIRRHYSAVEVPILVLGSRPDGACGTCAQLCGGDLCIPAKDLDSECFINSVQGRVAVATAHGSARLRRGPLTLIRKGHW